MPDFLGEDFHLLVSDLIERVKDVKAGRDKPRFVLLEAPSGSGKSRIVRELYEAMRNDPDLQPKDSAGVGYWPSLLSDTYVVDGINSGFKERKVLGPDPVDFRHNGQALPGFLWMPVRCDILSGTTGTSAIDLMLPHLRRHSPFVALSWRKAANPKENLSGWFSDNFKKELDVLLDNASVEVVLKVFEITLEVAFPMLAYGIDKAFGAGKSLVKKALPKKGVSASPGFDKDPSSTFNKLVRIVHADVPLVLVLEDAHLIDEPTAQLIRHLVAAGTKKPVVIVATAWPESRKRSNFERLTRDLDAAGQIEVFGESGDHPFPELLQAERVAIAREIAPNTSKETLDLIADIWRNPLALRLNLGSDRIQRSIQGNAITATAEELRKIPRDVQRIYEERWSELEGGLKEILMLVSGAIPKKRHIDGVISPVMSQILTDAVIKSKLVSADEEKFNQLIHLAISPVRWIIENELPEREVQFREVVLQLIAVQQFEDYFSDPEINTFRDYLVSEISRWVLEHEESWFDFDETAGLQVSRWLLDLVSIVEHREHVKMATAVAALSVANYEGYYWNVSDAVELLTSPAISGLSTDISIFRSKLVLGISLGRLGRTAEAITAFSGADEVLRTKFESSNERAEERYWIVANQAGFLASEGKIDEALGPAYFLLDEIEKLPDQESQSVFEQKSRILDQIAELHEIAGDYTTALEINARALALTSSIENGFAYWKVIPQVSHARLLYETGDLNAALSIIMDLVKFVDSATKELDADLLRQVYMAAGLINFYWGDYEESQRLLGAAQDENVRKGGENSDFGRSVRTYLAWMKVGDELPEQISMLNDVVTESKILLGARHPQLIAELGNLSNAYSELEGGEERAYELALEVLSIAREWRPVGDNERIHAERSAILLEPGRKVSVDTAQRIEGLYREACGAHGPAGHQAQACLIVAAREYASAGEPEKALSILQSGVEELMALNSNHNRFLWKLRFEISEVAFIQGDFDLVLASLSTLVQETLDHEGGESDAFQEAVMAKAEFMKKQGLAIDLEDFPELSSMIETWRKTHLDDANSWAEELGLRDA